jgi:hypothetical protein
MFISGLTTPVMTSGSTPCSTGFKNYYLTLLMEERAVRGNYGLSRSLYHFLYDSVLATVERRGDLLPSLLFTSSSEVYYIPRTQAFGLLGGSISVSFENAIVKLGRIRLSNWWGSSADSFGYFVPEEDPRLRSVFSEAKKLSIAANFNHTAPEADYWCAAWTASLSQRNGVVIGFEQWLCEYFISLDIVDELESLFG